MRRITLAVPSALVAQANQLAMCLGLSAADGFSFGSPEYQDDRKRFFSVASGLVSDSFVKAAFQPLKAPLWPVDLAAAQKAQAAIVIKDPEAPEPLLDMDISVIFHDDSAEALALFGLIRI